MESIGKNPTDVTYNSLIDVCVRCDKFGTGLKVLKEMKSKGIEPDNFTYSTLIKGIRASDSLNDLDQAFSFLADMKNSG